MKLTIFFISVLISSTIFGQLPEKFHEAAEFREIGPYRGGRSCAVTGVSGLSNVFYFGSTGGGVWKTEDVGRSWKNISDGFFGGSIGAISVSQSDKNVIFVGGGEKTVRGNVSSGNGVWKSIDAGRSWIFCGLENSKHISRIRIHPTNPDIVWAAVMGDLFKDSTERGVFKSIDGGKTWKKVLYVNQAAGAVDLVVDPNNSRNLFASTWNVRRTPYSLSSGGEGSSIWKSTDYGETWKELKNNKGLPEGVWGIVGLAVSHFNSDIIWALIENEKGGIYRSSDGGETWVKINEDRALRQRAWYYSRIYSDTNDPNTIYVTNVAYHKSIDGGKTFKSDYAPHGDHHDLWIDPQNSKRMIIGDDGGAQISQDGGEFWTSYYNQPTAQFYRVTTDNHFPYRIYAAQQDNSAIRINSRSSGGSISENDWTSTAGGESAHIAVDPNNSEIVYGGSYGGFLTRVDHENNETRAINIWPDNPMGYGAEGMKYRFQWNFPLLFSQHNKKRLYAFSNHVHYTEDEGQTWVTLSKDLTRNEPSKLVSSGGPITQDNTGVEYYCTIFAASESPVNKEIIWIGTDDGLVQITRDEGKSWNKITPKNLPEWSQINSIEASKFDEATAYLAATSYKNGDYEPYLFRTTDFGNSWVKITNGIDKQHFTRVIREDQINENLLFAGTESGLYFSSNKGEEWKIFQKNLPIVPITDLAIKGNDLIVATQGRGLWSFDYLNVIRESLEAKVATNYVFQPGEIYRMSGYKQSSPKQAGTNKYNGLELLYYIDQFDEEKDTISIEIPYGEGKKLVFSNKTEKEIFKLKPKAGSNKFEWDLKFEGARKFDKMILWWGELDGPKASPGQYDIVFKKNGERINTTFSVLKNPSSTSTIEDISAQIDFINSIVTKVDEAHEVIIEIKGNKAKMDNLLTLTEDKEILALVEQIDSISKNVEINLYQTKNQSNQDPLNFPIKLTNKLAHLNALAQMSDNDFPPTSQSILVRDELIQKIDIELMKYYDVRNRLIPTLNDLILLKKVSFLKIPNQ